MTDPQSSESSGLPHVDFDALYRGESPADGVPAMVSPPWDIHAPKENVVGWHTAGLVRGAVLDVGCGYGDNTIYLAQRGFGVTGVDISPTALITARRRAADAGVTVTFAVADATTLDGYTDAFDTVVDSGMFHCLDDAGKRHYAAASYRAARAGATLLISCFCDAQPAGAERALPVVVSEQTVRDTLSGGGWNVASVQPSTLHRTQDDGTEATMAFWLVRAQRLA